MINKRNNSQIEMESNENRIDLEADKPNLVDTLKDKIVSIAHEILESNKEASTMSDHLAIIKFDSDLNESIKEHYKKIEELTEPFKQAYRDFIEAGGDLNEFNDIFKEFERVDIDIKESEMYDDE